MNKIKSFFITGLITILPLVITFYIFNWLLNIVLNLIRGTIITKVIRKLLVLIYSGQGYQTEFEILVYIISIIIIFIFIIIVGCTMKFVFFSKIIGKLTRVVEKIPIIKTVYSTIRQIIDLYYLSEEETLYKKVVAVEYPRKGLYAIGFMTAENNKNFESFLGDKDIVNVFIPTSPNPTSGMLVCVPKEEVHKLDISVEMAFKLIISGGYVSSDNIKKLEEIEDKK
ncbi:MAG: DUF502 domain-containing protein [Fusobacterium sp.]|nr:DUF502 domain-containing protein [Fusobacterium sp.]